MSKILLEVSKDGNQFCVLLGENLQVGIAAFGDTMINALRNFIEVLGNETGFNSSIFWEKFIEDKTLSEENKKHISFVLGND